MTTSHEQGLRQEPGVVLASREVWSGLEPSERSVLRDLRALYLVALQQADDQLRAERA
jgi:hypothetical protein